MQRHALPVLILALAVALPARASHTHHHHHLAAKVTTVTQPTATATVAALPRPADQTPASSKGSRLEAQMPVTAPRDAGMKVAAGAKKASFKSARIAVTPAIPAGLPGAAQPIQQGRLARLTAYWTDEDYWTSRHMSSTGAHLHEGNCAVDPKLIPYGSVVQIPGMRPYVAVDTGSAVVSRQAAVGSAHTPSQRDALVVDLFFENEHEAQQFAAHGPTFATVSWIKPLTAADAPKNPKALPLVTPLPASAPTHIAYELASAPSWGGSRLPLNFRSPQM